MIILEVRYNNYRLSVYRMFETNLPQIKTTNKDELLNKEKVFIERVVNFYKKADEIVDYWVLKEEK